MIRLITYSRHARTQRTSTVSFALLRKSICYLSPTVVVRRLREWSRGALVCMFLWKRERAGGRDESKK